MNGKAAKDEALYKVLEFTVCLLIALFLIVDIYMFIRFLSIVHFFAMKKKEKIEIESILGDDSIPAATGLKIYHKLVISFTVAIAVLDLEN